MDRERWLSAVRLVEMFGGRAPYVIHAEIMNLRRQLASEETIAALLFIDAAASEWRKPRGVAEPLH